MVSSWIGEKCFRTIHRHNLVYNTCWEDPRLDREALQLSSDDSVLVITSAGCNALDYLLQAPRRVFAVDLNPLQNALLELKVACIRTLSFDEFFCVFGTGGAAQWPAWYRGRVRKALSPAARSIWDRRIDFFDASTRRKSFYFRGSSGYFAWLINAYIDRVAKVRESIQSVLDAPSIQDQQRLFHQGEVRQSIWRPMIRWMIRRDATLSMLGVPRLQRRQIDVGYAGGIEQFIIDRLESVFTRLSLADNYFWRVYLTGSYTPTCCPEYLKRENFDRLRDHLIDRLETHTNSVAGFLRQHDEPVSRYILLDHMDWMCGKDRGPITQEWQAIVDRSDEHARVLWRSAGLSCGFVDTVEVATRDGRRTRVGELLQYHPELASSLHARDRVHTYGSFFIADISAA